MIAVHYSDYEQFSESEERLSQSSTDVTPQNSPRVSVEFEPRITREKISCYPKQDEESDFEDTFSSLLQITPIQIRSPYRKRQTHSILRSEVASSRWMRGNRPESSVNRGSAKSYVSLDAGRYAIDGKSHNGRVVTARHRDVARLEPIYTPEPPIDVMRNPQYGNRKVSLPPLSMDEERRKIASVGSAKRIGKYKKTQPKYNRPC